MASRLLTSVLHSQHDLVTDERAVELRRNHHRLVELLRLHRLLERLPVGSVRVRLYQNVSVAIFVVRVVGGHSDRYELAAGERVSGIQT